MTTIVQAAYIAAALLFIMALAGLSKHETAKTGNAYGVAGMVIAIVATAGLALKTQVIGVPATLGLIVVAMAIIAVLAAVTVVSVAGIANDARMATGKNVVVTALDNARALAIRRNMVALSANRAGRPSFSTSPAASSSGTNTPSRFSNSSSGSR